MAKVIVLVTSAEDLGKTGKKTGWYLPEVAHPVEKFEKKGYEITFASPKGGLAPCDPSSLVSYKDDKTCNSFKKTYLNDKFQLKTVAMKDLNPTDYDVLFYAGGHGTMFDFPNDKTNNEAAKVIYENGGIISAVCHGPAGLCNIKLSNGDYLVKDKYVTGFTDDEERAMKLEKVMPFLLETTLKERGAKFVGKENWKENVIVHERIVTGQNPTSATACAIEIIKLLDDRVDDDSKDDEKVDDSTDNDKINIILLVTNTIELGDTGKKTGWYLPEVAHPFEQFNKEGYNIIFASPKGGYAAADPASIKPYAKDDVCNIFKNKYLNNKGELNTLKMSNIKSEQYDVLFYCGGHGTMYDFYNDEVLHKSARIIYENGGIVSAVCHGPAGLCNIKLSNGEYLVKGKRVTGFTDDEERAVKLEKIMPFLLETELKKRGAYFVGKTCWKDNVIIDERLVTGQNPASADKCAVEIIKLIKNGISRKQKEKKIKHYCNEYASTVKEVLFTPNDIHNKCIKMGKTITKYYKSLKDNKPLIVVGLLRGAYLFISDLSRQIKCRHVIDFLMVKSYSGTKSTNVKILLDMNIDPEGKHILIVEDLVDTGKTLMWLKKHLKMKKAASVKIAVLLQKKTKRLHKNFNKEVELDFVGFKIDDHWICGYGMDYNQEYRGLACIVILKKETYTKEDKQNLALE